MKIEKKIAIVGMGVSGMGAKEYFDSRNIPCLCFDDAQESHLDISEIENYLNELEEVILSPGIPRENPYIAKVIEHQISVVSDVDFVFRDCKLPRVGVTGTNGKTTTVSLIGEFLQSQGKQVFIGGNIGTPAFDFYKHEFDSVVLELSSFQLESSPDLSLDMAFILNLSPNHQERYQNLADYQEAKLKIFNRGNKYRFLGEGINNQELLEKYGASPIQELEILSSLPKYQRQNYFCALKACEFILQGDCYDEFKKFIFKFKGVEHRQEVIVENDNWLIINDAKSTNLEATLASLEHCLSLKRPTFFLVGGKKRQESHKEGELFINELLKKKNDLIHLFTFGEVAKEMESVENHYETIEQCLESISARAKEGVICLSPGFPSFDQYKNYIDRGNSFKALVKKIYL